MRWTDWLCMVALAGGTLNLVGGCESSGRAEKDAGPDGPARDLALSAGGGSGAGGAIHSGGTTAASGDGGSAGTAEGGSAGFGTGGITSGAGGRATGGASTGSGGGTATGAGGAAMDGAVGTDGAGAGGTRPADAAATGGASGFDAGSASTYSGCMYIGGIDRALVAKFDPQAGLCVVLGLTEPSRGPDAGFGLTLTRGWGVDLAGLWASTSDNCAQRVAPAGFFPAASASGSVSIDSSSATIDVDAILYFPATDADVTRAIELKARGVSINHGCQ